jgi:excinuclease ABC subunit C
LYLIQRIRDEAHRFAITSHRRLRTKTGLASQLDAIPGIGSARRKLLLNHFGSIQDIQNASIEELTAVPGITEKIAQSIKAHLD